ncbi:MAG TPA: DUF4136 domain-containing protein [Bryobacteraceae bacterium]|jgi:hypothetical protein|nr:DUF4136 domain-containing protein [Bryobacteraceae bacterium]
MKLIGILLLSALVAGRALAQKIDVEFDESAVFERYKTFHIVEGQLNAKAAALNSDLTRRKIENEIRKRLTEKGLTEVESKPDLNVRFTLGQARKTEVEAYPAGWRGLGTRRVRVAYTQGTLVINLRDTSRKELVWRSVAEEEKNDPMQIAQHLDDMVKKSIDKYPPKK